MTANRDSLLRRTERDDLIAGIGNLRGHRCNDQTRYLAHVDAVYAKACALAENHQDAVDLLCEIGAMAGSKATGADARAMAARAREFVARVEAP